jgi:oxaloacetate decarboxylase gamma subunit
MQDSLMQQGIDLMLYGMGTVVIFLAILVVATQLMSKVLQRYFAEPDMQAAPVKMVEADHGSLDPRLLAVIKAALDQHRAKHR